MSPFQERGEEMIAGQVLDNSWVQGDCKTVCLCVGASERESYVFIDKYLDNMRAEKNTYELCHVHCTHWNEPKSAARSK